MWDELETLLEQLIQESWYKVAIELDPNYVPGIEDFEEIIDDIKALVEEYNVN